MKQTRRDFLATTGKLAVITGMPMSISSFAQSSPLEDGLTAAQIAALPLGKNWAQPARTFKPHTRWWWPGSAVTKEGISWELEQMQQQGMGGVEIMCPHAFYEKGNIDYLSPEWLSMVRFTIDKARSLDMEVAITFGAGWSFGGSWVPPAERSKCLTQGWADLEEGGATFDGELPAHRPRPGTEKTGFHSTDFVASAPDEQKILAVVAGKLTSGDEVEGSTLVDITASVKGNHLHWTAPDKGRWRIFVYRLKYTGQRNQMTEDFPEPQWTIDNLDPAAVTHYCEYLGGVFQKAFGDEFSKTVDTLFADSFEVLALPDSLLWSDGVLARFQQAKGYDLTPYLPAIWWNIGDLTPRIRYDVNSFLSDLGLEAFFKPFTSWCRSHGIEARVQPHYRYTTELIAAAGTLARPETEMTTRRFEVLADPRKAEASGGRLYGSSRIFSAEAFTFLHQMRYETSLEDMKIAADAFLRDGVTQFWNHGYTYSPEMHVAPTRDMPWANRISHWNTWWPYYHYFAAYITRCCYLLRQGRFAADVLVYAPQATTWSEKAMWFNDRRYLTYGSLPNTLVANGYDFDVVNDDLLQHRATINGKQLQINGYSYRAIILPRIKDIPIESMKMLADFVAAGGTVIALDSLPSASAGKVNAEANDAELKTLVDKTFSSSNDTAHFIPEYKILPIDFDPGHQPPYKPQPELTGARAKLIQSLNHVISPDFILEGNRQSNGLTFMHRRLESGDLYFVTNLTPMANTTPIRFRVANATAQAWNPATGEVYPLAIHAADSQSTTLQLDLDPYASCIVVFTPGSSDKRVPAAAQLASELQPLPITGDWHLTLEGYGFTKLERSTATLFDWIGDPTTSAFSGTGVYEITFDCPAAYLARGIDLTLDLGKVGDIAEVLLNGKPAGTAWMQPFHLDVTGLVRAGSNTLTVRVTNELMNYVASLKTAPDVPAELQAHYGHTRASQDIPGLKKELNNTKNLPPSGLMGPVRLVAKRQP